MARLLQSVLIAFALTLWFAAPTAHASGADLARHPLKPPDTSSPRTTFRDFMADLSTAYRVAQDPSVEGSDRYLARAARTLDLSRTPAELRLSVGIETALLLKEVIDRLEIPGLEAIPTADAETPARWRVPNTPITIALIAEGPRAGEYLFSAETVARAGELYDRVRDLPYREGGTPGIYVTYLTTPGLGLESGWSDVLPAWTRGVFLEQTYWQWIALTLNLLLLGIAYTPAIRIAGRIAAAPIENDRNGQKWRPGLIAALLLGLAGTVFSEWFLEEVINLTGGALVATTYLLALIRYGTLCWLAVAAVSHLGALIIYLRGVDATAASARLLRLGGWVITGLLIVGVLVTAGQDFGFPVYSIVTGLGVGGIALGFGAQTLVRDVLSGVFFLVDDAFREGEYIQAGSVKGRVERISIRSVQLRHHNGPLNTVPFGEMKQITNFSRDWVIMKLPIRVPFGTDTEHVRKVIKKLGLALLEDPEMGPKFIEPLKSQGVLQIDDFGIVIRVKYMTQPGEQFTLRRFVYMKVQEAFEREGIPFAGREVRIRLDGAEEPTSQPALSTAVASAAALGDDEPMATPARAEER